MISWMAIRLLFSGAAKRLLKGLSAAFEWLLSDPRNIPLLVCAAMWAVNALLIVPARNRDIAQRDGQIIRVSLERDAEAAAHLGTVNAFLAASKQAQKDAEANAQRVAREQEIITDATLSNLRSDHADLRARFDRLRRARDTAQINPGRADPAGLPGLSAAPGRINAAAPDHNLRAPGTGELSPKAYCPADMVCLSIDEAEAASEDAHRFNRLIDWVLAQSAVRFTPDTPTDGEPAR